MDQLAAKLANEALGALLNQSPSRCVLTDIGQLLVELAGVVARVSDRLVESDLVGTRNTQAVLRQVQEHTDGSESHHAADYLNDRRLLLRKLRDGLEASHRSASEEWSTAGQVPRYITEATAGAQEVAAEARTVVKTRSSSGDLDAFLDRDLSSASPPLDGLPRKLLPGVASFDFDVSQINFDMYDQKALLVRGKGTYECPEGQQCTKGGFKDGMVVVFTRNSDFRAHIAKHERKYACDLPGCPNKPGKRKFAREDQLRRHQENVHRAPNGS